tara:strand:- start:1533 stop:2924 length:1392 start_codon:yes stop_codon:yes gene_type:complete
MKYRSTRDSSLIKPFSEVLLGGLAPDGGLYMPHDLKTFNLEEIKSFSSLSYHELTAEILYEFVKDELSKQEFKTIISNSYQVFEDQEVVNLIELEERRWILELFHGPTLAFKDIAMQLLGGLLGYFVHRDERKVAVLGATSGDTGSAAISAFSRQQGIDIFILYPHKRVTDIQRKQMTTSQSNNVHALAVETDFDGCQAMVKELFLDSDILSNSSKFIAANSINWARCMTQSVYYFWTYLKLQDQVNEIVFSVPSGNFGHSYAGWLAKEMGLPIKKILVATNTNEVLHKLFSTNIYQKGEVTPTIAPSMDISVASNFERLLYNLLNNDSKKLLESISQFPDKEISIPEESWKTVKDFFESSTTSDQEILDEINQTYIDHDYVLDPHTATGVKAARDLGRSEEHIVTMATAHPAKFVDVIKKVLSKEAINKPNQLSAIEDLDEDFVVLPDKIDKVREYILSNVG